MKRYHIRHMGRCCEAHDNDGDWVRYDDAVAIEQERDALKARLALAEELLQGWSGEVDIPDRNCSCHISPPCGDCVTYGGLRDLDEQTTRFLEAK